MKKSILKKTFFAMMGFGLSMGIVFPIYANFFVNWKENMFIWFVSGCLIAGLMVGIISFLLTKFIIIKQLIKIADISKKVANKDLTERLDIKSNDIIGEIVDSFNLTIESYNNTLKDLTHKSDSLNNIIINLTSSSNNLTDSSTSQFSTAGVLRNDIEHIVLSLREINDESINATNSMKNIHDSIKENLYLIDDLKKTMDELNISGREIQEITTVINGISFQTNLLALNASVEAARAGESGRGFSVVANEVRNLSNKTAESSTGINSILTENISIIKSGLEISKETSEFFLSLTPLLDKVNENFLKVSQDIENQLDNFNSLNTNIKSMTSLSESNMDLASDLNNVCKNISGNSAELSILVNEFSLRSE